MIRYAQGQQILSYNRFFQSRPHLLYSCPFVTLLFSIYSFYESKECYILSWPHSYLEDSCWESSYKSVFCCMRSVWLPDKFNLGLTWQCPQSKCVLQSFIKRVMCSFVLWVFFMCTCISIRKGPLTESIPDLELLLPLQLFWILT